MEASESRTSIKCNPMKIYTKTGDQGETGLFGAGRVGKNHPRIEAYGNVDEANAVLGWARTGLLDHPELAELDRIILRVQGELFVVGADLATPDVDKPSVPRIAAQHITQLEKDLDALDADLPALRHFIMPGGSEGAARLQVARTVTRRAERFTVELAARETINPLTIQYLNRLSDLLFVMARWANWRLEIEDPIWVPETE